MGIINVTPDSFAGDGVGGDLDRALDLARQMVQEGADLLDIGGESTRPTAKPITADEEIIRTEPIIRAIVDSVSVPVSIDTRRSVVAEAALQAGAHLVNDVGGLQRDSRMAGVVAAFGASVIAMHSPGPAWEVPWPATYGDIIADVLAFLERSVKIGVMAGIPRDQIAIDPGFGFGKSVEDNLKLIRRLSDFRAIGQPVLLGTSRKSTLGRILNAEVTDRLEGSLATLPLAIAQGVDIVRVHDVGQSVRVVRVADAVVRASGGQW
jgi:dihydropteroate synthase